MALHEPNDSYEPNDAPVPETDHDAGRGAGVHPGHVGGAGVPGPGAEPAGAGAGEPGARAEPVSPSVLPVTPGASGGSGRSGARKARATPPVGLIGGLSPLQVVAAVSLGAVLAAGLAAAVVAAIGNGEEDDQDAKPEAAGKPKRRTAVAPRPRKERVRAADPVATGPRVNLNEADDHTLTTLQGIGPAMAVAILARRPFHSVDELAEVAGVGPALLEKLRPLLTV